MSQDYEPYSEYKKKQEQKKANNLKMIVYGLVTLLFLGGMFWGGKAFYNWLVPGANGSNVTSKPGTQATTQANKPDAKAPTPDAAADSTQKSGPYANLYGKAKYLIHIHKQSYKLELFEKGKEAPLKTYSIAIAKNDGDKKRPGDNTTPTSWGNAVAIPKSYTGAKSGVPSTQVPFRVEEIVDASSWSHDFHDGKGVIEKAYGPWFISLDTGWDGIGIHGTHDPSSIGTKASEGCIRLQNAEVKELKEIISSHNKGIGTRVIITEE